MPSERINPLVQELITKGLLTPESNNPVANTIHVPKEVYQKIVDKFPAEYQYKLGAYTGEELYYLYRICIYKPKLEQIELNKHRVNVIRNSGDAMLLSLKSKTFKWLKGELRSGVNTSILNRVGRKYRQDFYQFVLEHLTDEMLANFTKEMNNRRMSGA